MYLTSIVIIKWVNCFEDCNLFLEKFHRVKRLHKTRISMGQKRWSNLQGVFWHIFKAFFVLVFEHCWNGKVFKSGIKMLNSKCEFWHLKVHLEFLPILFKYFCIYIPDRAQEILVLLKSRDWGVGINVQLHKCKEVHGSCIGSGAIWLIHKSSGVWDEEWSRLEDVTELFRIVKSQMELRKDLSKLSEWVTEWQVRSTVGKGNVSSTNTIIWGHPVKLALVQEKQEEYVKRNSFMELIGTYYWGDRNHKR